MDPIADTIAAFIEGRIPTSEETFNVLACRLFARQFEENAPYRRLCESYKRIPQNVSRWQDIPAVPAQAFKAFDLSCVPVQEVRAIFHSSGTMGGTPGRHFLDQDGLDLYEISLRQGFRAAVPDCPAEIWALMPPPHEAPYSSLSHMLHVLGAERYFWDDLLLESALDDRLAPVALFGTAFAFVQLFDRTGASWRLPEGSVVIETGGYKGRTREVPRDELYRLLSERFCLPTDRLVSEYGMSEMASQFYGHGLDPIKRRPHWVRTRSIDPLTGDDATGEGALRHFDLANFNSVLAIQTQDLGILCDEGFVLHGRSPNAEVRGCSLAVEELWTEL